MNDGEMRVGVGGRVDGAAKDELDHGAEHGGETSTKALVETQVDEKVENVGEREREAGESVDTEIALECHEGQTIEEGQAVTEHGDDARREHHQRDVHLGLQDLVSRSRPTIAAPPAPAHNHHSITTTIIVTILFAIVTTNDLQRCCCCGRVSVLL